MKHADGAALEQLAPLLNKIRQRMPPLKEKNQGIFYLKSAAFLHFHQDPSGLYADLKAADTWLRLPVTSCDDQAKLLQRIDEQLR